MATYIVRRCIRTYCEVEIEAESEDEAYDEAQDLQDYEWNWNPEDYDEKIISVRKKIGGK